MHLRNISRLVRSKICKIKPVPTCQHDVLTLDVTMADAVKM